MSNEFIWGSILSIFLTILGFWVGRKKRSNEIGILIKEFIPLLTSKNKEFKSLNIENYKLPYDSNIYFVNGFLINTGEDDIDESKIYKPLCIQFPKEVELVEYKVSQANDIEISSEKLDNSISIKWRLLKSKENIFFEFILKTDTHLSENYFLEIIEIQHRILNIKDVYKIHNKPTYNKNEGNSILRFFSNPKFGLGFVSIAIIGVCFFCTYACSLFLKRINRPDVKTLVSEDVFTRKDTSIAKASYYSEDTLLFYENNQAIKFTEKEFDKYFFVNPKFKILRSNYFFLFLWIIFSLLILWGLYSLLRTNLRQIKDETIYKYLNL